MERNYLTKRKGLDIIQEFLKLKQPQLKKFYRKIQLKLASVIYIKLITTKFTFIFEVLN